MERSLLVQLAFPLALCAIAAIAAIMYFGILRIDHGTFIYNLDDPYIHLALSDQIRHGNYGLHAGSHAAPSSSILYPFLLAIASGTALHPYLPLLLNLGGLFLTAYLMHKLFTHLGFVQDGVSALFGGAAIVLILLCTNTIAVVFTGLEHSLHIVTVAAIVYGLVLFLDREEVPSWLPVAIVLCPLFRYEGLALSVGALLILALRGRLRTAFATLAVMALLVGSFSLFLIKLGLAPLPSSVLTKLATVHGGAAHKSVLSSIKHILATFGHNVALMSRHTVGLMLSLVTVTAVYLTLREMRTRWGNWTASGLMSLLLACLLVGQAFVGKWGWLDRYEDYAVFGTLMIGIYLLRPYVRAALAPTRHDRLMTATFATVFLLIFGSRYLVAAANVPIASNNIYEQQYQMHRFLSGYWKGPVAVNDLGLVSYHNPEEVLDLGGLGSEKARILIAEEAGPDTYRDFVASNNIHLVLIYPEWFRKSVPDSWKEVGILYLSHAHLSAGNNSVSFYATDDATAATLRSELTEFQKTLPPHVRLVIK
jgi:hypothetical protein